MKHVKHLLFEIVPVVFGILLALLINNWNEERKDRAYLQKMLAASREELAETRGHLEEVVEGQATLLDTLDRYREDARVSIYDIIAKAGGITMPTVRHNAWAAIANGQIELLDYETINALSTIAEGKENLRFKSERMAEYVYDNMTEKGADEKGTLEILLRDANQNVRIMKETLAEYLEE